MALGNLAGLYGILEGISAGTDIQRQQQELQQRQQLFNQQQASARLQSQALQGLMQQGAQGGMPQAPPPIPPMPLPQVPPATAQLNAPGGGLPGIVAQLESGRGRDVASQPPSMADPTYGQYPGFVSQYGRGPAGVNRFAQAELAAKPDATLGDYYSDYVLGTGKPGSHTVADLASTAAPGARGAYGNLIRNAGVPASTPLVNLLRNDTTQAGMAALQAGVPQPAARDMVQTGQAAINQLDPTGFGVYSLPQVAQAVEKASGPDTDPVVKSMAIGGLMKLLQPQDQMMYRALMQQNRDALQIWKTTYSQQEQDARLRALETGRDVRAGEKAVAGEEKVPPQTQAFNAFMKAHPGATAEQQQQFLLSGRQPRSAQGMALRTFIDEFTAEHGKPPGSEDIRNFQAGTAEAVTEARGVGQRVGSLETAAQVLDGMTPLLEEASNKVDRTEYPTINKLILAYQEGTGDQNVVRYGEMLNEVRYLYGRALGGGAQARVADLNHFDEVMNKAWSTGQVKAGIEQIQKSIQVERDVLQKRRQEVGRGGGAAAPEKQQTQGDSVPVPESMKNEDDGVTIRNKSDGSLWIKKGNRLVRAPSGAEPTPAGQP